MVRVLVIGYGNPSRRDDGVGLAVVNGLRERLGKPPLVDNDDGFRELGGEADTLFLQQLNPELAETLAAYDHVWFVDAHLGAPPELVRRVRLSASLDPALVSHHFKPETLLALAGQMYGHVPRAELISILGQDFDFGEELSAVSADGVRQAVDALWREIAGSEASQDGPQ
jgi:hydrogenase maturation protease